MPTAHPNDNTIVKNCTYCVNVFCTQVVAVASFAFAQRAHFSADSFWVPQEGKPQAIKQTHIDICNANY